MNPQPESIETCPACGYEMYDGGIMTTNPAGVDQLACRSCADAWASDFSTATDGSENVGKPEGFESE
jgi:formate dehydrogenase maturation protein FdhE